MRRHSNLSILRLIILNDRCRDVCSLHDQFSLVCSLLNSKRMRYKRMRQMMREKIRLVNIMRLHRARAISVCDVSGA